MLRRQRRRLCEREAAQAQGQLAELGDQGDLFGGRRGHLDSVSRGPADAVDATALLVRPDGFVAWAATADTGNDGLEPALRRWFGDTA